MGALQQALLACGIGFDVNAQTMNATTITTTPTNATASIAISAAGAVNLTTIGTDFQLVEAGDPALLEIFMTLSVGTLTSGTTGSWVNIGSAPSWTKTQSVVGTSVASGTYAVRVAATGQVLATGIAWSLTATEDL